MANVTQRINVFPNILKKYAVINPLKLSACSYCKSSQLEENNGPNYPPVKPEYPSKSYGWGTRTRYQAWDLHGKAKEIMKINNVRDRLEKITWQEGKPTPKWMVYSLDRIPGTLSYKQHVTKTHVIDEIPDSIYAGLDEEVSTLSDSLASNLHDLVLQEHELCREPPSKTHKVIETKRQERYNAAYRTSGQLMNLLYGALGSKRDYLLRSQFAKNTRLESFWWKCGYGKDGVAGKILEDCLQFQIKAKTSYQIRMEQPLSEFVSIEDPLCKGSVPDVPYVPKVMLQEYKLERPFSVSGHWIGDPCEFSLMSMFVLDWRYDDFVANHGNALGAEEMKTFALVAGFGSTAAQAHNQGFNVHHDLTYPITNQLVVTDGQTFRFAAYQLNTLHLWQHNNPLRNLLWVSEPMRLYETIENGQVKGLNTDVLKPLLKFSLLGPGTATHDLRPFLPEEPAPGLTREFINHVGEEPLPQYKLGRREKPRHTLYW